MNKIFKKLTVIGAATIVASCAQTNQQTIDQKIDALYNKMSQEERIAQLHSVYLPQFFDENGKLDEAKCKELIPNGVGQFAQYALNNRATADQLRDQVAQMQDWLMKNTPNGIPAIFHEEVLSGFDSYDATIYPQQIGQACSFNTELAEIKTHKHQTNITYKDAPLPIQLAMAAQEGLCDWQFAQYVTKLYLENQLPELADQMQAQAQQQQAMAQMQAQGQQLPPALATRGVTPKRFDSDSTVSNMRAGQSPAAM